MKLKHIIYLLKIQEYKFNHFKMELREILSKIILYNYRLQDLQQLWKLIDAFNLFKIIIMYNYVNNNVNKL